MPRFFCSRLVAQKENKKRQSQDMKLDLYKNALSLIVYINTASKLEPPTHKPRDALWWGGSEFTSIAATQQGGSA
jgi:hypothetical protein